ncbi:pheromone autoinducer 2 transporter [Salinivirga cyanobacteriivorans]|uniref:Pheromone autoinducer 2 transporter n=1 Tax=Salinivirga cyanobacteriivorans TaxID=1307839 RepID=A0A0S2HY38_9BACT|nr:AI-2E family transporter [Salinivirga cyanobacteriivorans]ALO14983.1 pheromone autoinducer 2 transporter [Salinivirga cyanobacteriivorans]
MKVLRYLLIFLAVALFLVGAWYLSAIVMYIIISAVLALIGRPLADRLQRLKIKGKTFPSALAAAITLLTIWAVMITFFIVFIPLVIQEGQALSSINVNDVVENLKEPIQKVQNVYNEYTPNDEQRPLKEVASERLKSLLSISNITNVFSAITGALGNIFIALFSISFITFFFLKEKNMLTRFILLIVPTKWDSEALHAMLSIKKLLSRYFIGLVVQISLIFTGVTIGLSIVGIDFNHVMLIALFAALINVIPYIGPILGIIFGLTVGVATHLHLDFYNELMPLLGYMTIAFLIVQLMDNFLFQPLIFSNSVKAHPLEIFLVILTAGTLAGIGGMVLAIPSYTIIRVIAKEFFSKYRFVKKMTEKI